MSDNPKPNLDLSKNLTPEQNKTLNLLRESVATNPTAKIISTSIRGDNLAVSCIGDDSFRGTHVISPDGEFVSRSVIKTIQPAQDGQPEHGRSFDVEPLSVEVLQMGLDALNAASLKSDALDHEIGF